jgi:high-affinity nickel permease
MLSHPLSRKAFHQDELGMLAILALGFFLGMRHATDADHVVAVTTIVSRERSPRAALRVGALWGIGHTVTILIVGGAIVLFGLVIPARVGLSMEFSVAVMLVVLGTMNVTGALRRVDEAAHQASTSAHAEHHKPSVERPAWNSRPLIVGVVHGLAGSAAIALLVLATIRDAEWALLYLLIFGVGTVMGMMLLTSAMALPVALAAQRFSSFERGLTRVTGFASISFGLFLAYRIGFVDGLFLPLPVWSPH